MFAVIFEHFIGGGGGKKDDTAARLKTEAEARTTLVLHRIEE